MNSFNVLILCAGRRVELIQSFQKAAKRLNINSKIIAGDYSNTAAALYMADQACKLPLAHDSSYITTLIDVCNRENIALIIPTIDVDLLILARNKRMIEENTNAKVLIADTSVVEICRDKIKTQEFLQANSFGAPKMYTDSEVTNNPVEFPLFIKPKSGSASINTFIVNNSDEFKVYRNIVEEPIIQEFIEGDEYTIDVFLDWHSNVITTVPRLRLETRAGEISKGKIIKDPEIINDVNRLMDVLKPIGHITVQLMKTKQGIKYIEINPRFGGGAPMSIQSGADSCENLFKLLKGESLKYNEDYTEDLTFVRFDQSICIDYKNDEC
ncbi:ATP-grasp domain-containing protein [Alkalibacillus haloalkaliphilus]|uniref:ATP-grasp domain-containing protein n=1 Tax=Alkalibacillus haloalkaliphilus TaxID=94136 RepID=UPI0029357442|nr:ATP-grasp domain-containing protein [Alkalibacillus haloalkaliphilus]MDV2583339.1 ATP-grasp domain-containing protein [Alkalibacillus haloalkaliphilus]